MKIGEEKVVDTAFRLFKQRGVRLTSLQTVARACGATPLDINLIFKSKKELVLAVISNTLNRKTSYLLINSSLSPSAVGELKAFFKFIDESMIELGADILNEAKRYHTNALDQLGELVVQKLKAFLQRNIERGLREGFYRDTLDSEQYGAMYFFVLRAILESPGNWDETKKAVTHLNDIFLHGVLNMKGMRV